MEKDGNLGGFLSRERFDPEGILLSYIRQSNPGRIGVLSLWESFWVDHSARKFCVEILIQVGFDFVN